MGNVALLCISQLLVSQPFVYESYFMCLSCQTHGVFCLVGFFSVLGFFGFGVFNFLVRKSIRL